MQHGGFLDNRRTNPAGLALVVAGHAAVLTAIALAPPEAIQRIIYLPTIVSSIPEAAPPPPPQRKARRTAEQAPTTTEQLVESVDPTPLLLKTPPLEPLELPQTTTLEPIRSEPAFLPTTIDPRAMADFQPDYPSQLVRAGIEGIATVRVLVGSDGRVKTIEAVSATDPAFFDATRRQALRFWRFKPATRDGIATESWRTMTVRFKLQS